MLEAIISGDGVGDAMRDADDAWSSRTPAYTRERLTDLYLKYHETVEKPPKLNKMSRKFECGATGCEAGYKSVQELERHYAESHSKPE